MALPQKTNPLFAVLVVLMAALAGYVYYTQVPPAEMPPPPESIQKGDFVGFKDFKLDLSMLSDQRFVSLKIYGPLPIVPEAGGRTDPFASY